MKTDTDSLIRALKANIEGKQEQIERLANEVDAHMLDARHQRALAARLYRQNQQYIHAVAGSYSEN